MSVVNVDVTSISSASDFPACMSLKRDQLTMPPMLPVDFFDAVQDDSHVLFAHSIDDDECRIV